LKSGTQIGIEGVLQKYSFYPYLAREDVIVYGCIAAVSDPCPGEDPDYIISLRYPFEHPGYKVLRTDTIHYVAGEDFTAYTYERDHPAPLGPRPPGCTLP